MQSSSLRNGSSTFPSALARFAGSADNVSKSSATGGDGSPSGSSTVNNHRSSSATNSLLRFSVDALAGHTSANDIVNNGPDPALPASKLELNDLGLMGMAARLGYSGYFGGLSGFPALNQLNQAFGNIGALVGSSDASAALSSAGVAMHHLHSHHHLLQQSSSASSGHVMSDEDDDLLDDDDDRLDENVSITSWDADELNSDDEDELSTLNTGNPKQNGIKKQRTAAVRAPKSNARGRPKATNHKDSSRNRSSADDLKDASDRMDDDAPDHGKRGNRRHRGRLCDDDTLDNDEDEIAADDDNDDDDGEEDEDVKRLGINLADDGGNLINIMDDGESGRAH